MEMRFRRNAFVRVYIIYGQDSRIQFGNELMCIHFLREQKNSREKCGMEFRGVNYRSRM